jgi:hypothetical protein
MTPANDDWSPAPEVLAAYFDGELAGRPDQEPVRRRIADWLRHRPEARAILDDYRRLAELWRETSPPDPGTDAWHELRARIAEHRRSVAASWLPRRLVYAALSTAAAIALVAALYQLIAHPMPAHPDLPRPTSASEDIEVFAVATAAEVVILRVEGADTQTLVVGELPLRGPLELAGPGEVVLTSVQPDERDQMMPHVRMAGPRPPLIWARIEPESMEP